MYEYRTDKTDPKERGSVSSGSQRGRERIGLEGGPQREILRIIVGGKHKGV